MLYFSVKPDAVFFEIVLGSLELSYDHLRGDHIPDDMAMNTFYEQTEKIFSRKELLSQGEKLLNAHKSKKLFRLTDYHFLILYNIISQAVSFHNDPIGKKEEALFSYLKIKIIDMDILTSSYFWDTDFFIPPDNFNKIPAEEKERLGFSEETFDVIHCLKPHPDEIKLSIVELPDDWREGDYDKPGEDYPYLKEQ